MGRRNTCEKGAGNCIIECYRICASRVRTDEYVNEMNISMSLSHALLFLSNDFQVKMMPPWADPIIIYTVSQC
jgi:hypothetical protein